MRTIDEVCGQPPGSFAGYLQAKNEYLQKLENKRKERIRAFLKQKRKIN